MKKFFHDYSYSIFKMFLYQIAIALFGIALFSPTIKDGLETLNLVTSIFAIIFYLFLIYVLTWEIGAKDRVSVDAKKKTYRPHTGLLLSLIANIPNLLLAFVNMIFTLVNPLASFRVIPTLLHGMYWGVIRNITLPIGGEYLALQQIWVTFYLLVIPAMLTCWLAYFMGFKNIRIIAKAPKKPQDKPNIKK